VSDYGKDFLISGYNGQDALAQAKLQQIEAQAAKAERSGKGSKASKLTKGEPSPAELAEMEKAATQFEALLLHQMFKAMWNTVPKGGLLSGSSEEGHYRDMLNQELADQISESQGIGIKDVIMRDLNKYRMK